MKSSIHAFRSGAKERPRVRPSPVRPSVGSPIRVRPREKARREREKSRRPSASRPSHRTRKGSPIAQCTFDAHTEEEREDRIALPCPYKWHYWRFLPLKNRESHRHGQALGNCGTVAELEVPCIECLEPFCSSGLVSTYQHLI